MTTDDAEWRRRRWGFEAALADELARSAAAAARGEEPALAGLRFAPRVAGGRVCVLCDWVSPPSVATQPQATAVSAKTAVAMAAAPPRLPPPPLPPAAVAPSMHVTRSLGDRDMSRLVVARPGVRSLRLEAGSRARLVLASDGVRDAVSDTMLRALLKK